MHCKIVMFSYRMPSHAKNGPPTTHKIPEASVIAALANLESHSIVIDWDNDDSV